MTLALEQKAQVKKRSEEMREQVERAFAINKAKE